MTLLPWYTEVINKHSHWWLKKSSYVKSFISISWTLGLWDLLSLLSCQMNFLSFDIGDWDRRWTFDLYIDAKKLWGGWCIWIITSALVLFFSFDLRDWDWRWTRTHAWQYKSFEPQIKPYIRFACLKPYVRCLMTILMTLDDSLLN